MAQTHLIIGAGNMGGALLSGWIKTSIVSPRNVSILDPQPGVEAVYAIERGAKHLSGPETIPKATRTVLLAVKPQMFDTVNQGLSDALPDGTLIISIMAGISTSALRNAFPHCVIVRAMPNTPAAIGRGVTAYIPPDDPEDQDDGLTEKVEALLSSCGAVVRVKSDDQLNAITAVSGSGPAYLFHFCEALTDAAQSLGLDAETSATLARETVMGAAELMHQSERSPGELREAVTSTGGTTQAGLDILMSADGLSDIMKATVRAAYARAKELAN